MIISRPLQDAVRGVGRNALDLPVAGLAAAAALFVAFALPDNLLSGLVGATGLPSLLPAAAPPLGLTARIAIGIAAALAAFGLVLMLLRVLDRSGLDKPRSRVRAPQAEAPKTRRRDFHPDAPAPRPISAVREFGEPAPPVSPGEPAPFWMADPDPDPEPAAPVAEPVPVPEPEPKPEPMAESVSTLPELMARLERGLERRRARPSAPMPQVFPEAGDDRLQNAIDSLQRLAARQS